jgi:hypothetical protein
MFCGVLPQPRLTAQPPPANSLSAISSFVHVSENGTVITKQNTPGWGKDILEGGEGDDFLWGGLGSDTFVYNTGDGSDLIRDFTKGEDMIELSCSDIGIANWDNLSGYIGSDVDGTALITFSEDDSILLANIRPQDLEASDFAFV